MLKNTPVDSIARHTQQSPKTLTSWTSPPPLTHAEVPRRRDATELNNDGIIKLGEVCYQTEPILSIFSKEI